jgi:mRNA-degrading endonuclease toxin of MazEF toxin-antitoxin module
VLHARIWLHTLGCEGLLFALELDLDDRLAALVDDGEGEVLHVGLHLSVGELATNQSLGVEDGVDGVHGDLVLRRVTDETLGVCEGDERRRCAVALVVGDDLNAVVPVDTDARVRGTQVDTDGGAGGSHGDGVCMCSGVSSIKEARSRGAHKVLGLVW